MNWLLPGFLAGTCAVALPVALHFLRSRPKTTVLFPTLRFLAPSAIRDTRRHRLQRWITLALRCLIIGLLAAAFARPFFARPRAGRGQAVVVAVDNSMSMQAGARWEKARSFALQQLAGLGPGDEAGVLLMNPAPTWLVPVSEDLGRVRTVLLRMEPGFETTRYMPALRLAGQTLATLPARNQTVVWMADEQRLGWLGAQFSETLPAGVKLSLGEIAPAPKSQAAITSVAWQHGDAGLSLDVAVRLYTPDRQARTLTVKAAGKTLAQQPVQLLNAAENKIRIPLKVAPEALAQGLSVSLDPDGLPADDTAWLAPPPVAAHTVLFFPGSDTDSRFLDHALAALNQLGANGFAAQPFPDGDWPAGSVVIATGPCFRAPLLARLDRFVAAGGALWIAVDGSPGQTQWLAAHGVRVTERAAAAEPSHLRDWDLEHPILAPFAGQSLLPLMEIGFQRSFALAGENLTAVANWPDGTAGLAEWSAGTGRIFLSGFPLDRAATDWPVQPSFVPFVHGAARWLAAISEGRTEWRVGDTIPLPDEEGTWRAVEAARPQPDQKASGSVRPAIPGLYEFSNAKTRQLFAVNPPLGESDLAPWPDQAQLATLQSRTDAPRAPAVQRAALHLSDQASESQQRLWWWAVAIAGAALLAELAVANRTAL